MSMIRSFRDGEAEKLFNDEFSRKYQAIERLFQRKLTALDEAETLEDMAALPGNHLEALKRDRKGQHSIRINDQYRLCFVWADGHATDVEIVDYH
jgi:proteic killer suppression protein